MSLIFPTTIISGSQLGQTPKGAIEVRIPTYDTNGRLNWELEADEVDIMDNGIYSAKKPKIYILENQKPVTTAQSNSGIFDIGRGLASGNESLLVEGDGYEAIGRPWTFEENISGGNHKLAFSERGKIGFDDNVDDGFFNEVSEIVETSSRNTSDQLAPEEIDEIDFSKEFPTTAFAKLIEILDLGDGKRRILLEDDVQIKIEDLETNSSIQQYSTIVCNWAEIILGNQRLESKIDSFGKISKIHAKGNVELIQPLRRSSGEELKWSDKNAQIELLGNAQVYHQKWGKAQGEKIIISEKDGRAEVIGGNRGRSRLSLPALKQTKTK